MKTIQKMLFVLLIACLLLPTVSCAFVGDGNGETTADLTTTEEGTTTGEGTTTEDLGTTEPGTTVELAPDGLPVWYPHQGWRMRFNNEQKYYDTFSAPGVILPDWYVLFKDTSFLGEFSLLDSISYKTERLYLSRFWFCFWKGNVLHYLHVNIKKWDVDSEFREESILEKVTCYTESGEPFAYFYELGYVDGEINLDYCTHVLGFRFLQKDAIFLVYWMFGFDEDDDNFYTRLLNPETRDAALMQFAEAAEIPLVAED